MSLAFPPGLLLALALPLLVVFYLLKVQPIDRQVGSAYLWERLLPDLAAHQPWRRPRFPPLFFAQAAIIAALAFAASRPVVYALAPSAVSVVYVLDATASMQATDVAPSRFERARRLLREEIASLPEGSRGAIVVAGSRASVAIADTGDRSALIAAVDGARVTDGAASVPDALRLADSLVRSTEGRPGEIRVFSDGAFDWPESYPPPTAAVRWIRVNGDGANLGITGFGARSALGDGRRQQLLARAQRFGSEATAVQIELRADGEVVETRTLTFDERGATETIFSNLPDGSRLIEARLSAGDALRSDDRAYLVVEKPRETRVLLVTRGNLFLERALALVPGTVVDRATPRRFEALSADGYDVLVVDGEVPDAVSGKPLLLVGPTTSPLIPVEGPQRATGIAYWKRDHPLMRHVDLGDVRVFRSPRVATPDWAEAVVTGADGPLLLAGEVEGRRVAALVPDLRQTNLPLTPAFPILVANAISYLEPPGLIAATSLPPGSDLLLSPAPEAREITIVAPSGRATTLATAGGPVSFRDTEDAGLYVVRQRSGDRIVGELAFAVNVVSAPESDIRSREPPATREPEDTPTGPVAREGSWLFLAAGLLALVGEWWWYHRRG